MFRIGKECHQIFNLLYIMIFVIHHFFWDKNDSLTMSFHFSKAKGNKGRKAWFYRQVFNVSRWANQNGSLPYIYIYIYIYIYTHFGCTHQLIYIKIKYSHIHNKNMHDNSIPLDAWRGRKINIGKILLDL
jgi:hypothetical protein